MKKLSLNLETLHQLTVGETEKVEGAAIIQRTTLCTKAIISCLYVCFTQIPQNCY